MRHVICLALLLVLPATALAARAPTDNERTAIRHAVSNSPKTDGLGCLRTRHIRVSTAGPWASGVAHPCQSSPDAVAVVLKRRHGRWHVKDIGNGQVGCGAPKEVRRDLDLC
ncbi:MAG: hypothetical protein QOI80_1736 [Solirubrobacteraceae bacterium]|nr:hypothetical protein [Solirubrobacteraceae bacterium]